LWGTANNGVRGRLTRKSGKFEPIDKVSTPSYLSASASQARSGGGLYVGRRNSLKSATLRAHRRGRIARVRNS